VSSFLLLLRSVGCILGEILGRKAMFPGRDYMHQLSCIINVLGTPSYEDTEYIASEKAKAYIRSLPYKKKVNYRTMFPKAPELALDLLEKMLTFAPEKRITVEEALAHVSLRIDWMRMGDLQTHQC
jgi:serine/threonine protein kinase